MSLIKNYRKSLKEEMQIKLISCFEGLQKMKKVQEPKFKNLIFRTKQLQTANNTCNIIVIICLSQVFITRQVIFIGTLKLQRTELQLPCMKSQNYQFSRVSLWSFS